MLELMLLNKGAVAMEHWKELIESIEKWQYTKRVPGTMENDREVFINKLNKEFILLKRDDVEKNETVFKPGIDPPEGIIQ